MVKIVNGRAMANKITQDLKEKISEMSTKPGLATILVGDDKASKLYVKKKHETCEEIGIHSENYHLDRDIEQKELNDLIDKLNVDSHIHGILVQLPLPEHLDENKTLNGINPQKDVDGLHPQNMGQLLNKNKSILPCTPKGIIRILQKENIPLTGKHVVIVGTGKLVGRPLAAMMLNRYATITLCNKKTNNMTKHTKQANILIVAVGKAELITADMIKDNCVVIDVGINKKDSKICGDVDFENVKDKASLITPVPGGVGPITVAMLMENVLELAKCE